MHVRARPIERLKQPERGVWKAAPKEENTDWLVGLQDTVPTRSTGCISVSLPHYCKEHGPIPIPRLPIATGKFTPRKSSRQSVFGRPLP